MKTMKFSLELSHIVPLILKNKVLLLSTFIITASIITAFTQFHKPIIHIKQTFELSKHATISTDNSEVMYIPYVPINNFVSYINQTIIPNVKRKHDINEINIVAQRITGGVMISTNLVPDHGININAVYSDILSHVKKYEQDRKDIFKTMLGYQLDYYNEVIPLLSEYEVSKPVFIKNRKNILLQMNHLGSPQFITQPISTEILSHYPLLPLLILAIFISLCVSGVILVVKETLWSEGETT